MDFSSLMPSAERLEAMASAVVARLTVRRVRMRDAMPRQLLRWAGPSLAIGAGFALSLCLWATGVTPEPEATPSVTQWALSGEAPSAKNILETFDNGEDAQP